MVTDGEIGSSGWSRGGGRRRRDDSGSDDDSVDAGGKVWCINKVMLQQGKQIRSDICGLLPNIRREVVRILSVQTSFPVYRGVKGHAGEEIIVVSRGLLDEMNGLAWIP